MSSNTLRDLGQKLKDVTGIKTSTSNMDIASKLTTALSTTVENGFNKQVAIIQVVDLMQPLENKYSFMDKGDLAYGIGEMTLTMRFKESEESNSTIDEWIPSGALNGLERVQSTSTGAIQRKVGNSYSELDMREFVRDAGTFAQLIAFESGAGAKTKQREHREAPRHLFGINVPDKLLPADYKLKLANIKSLINQNRIVVTTTTNNKSIVNYLHEFADKYYANYSNEYNAGRLPTKTGTNLWIGGVDTGVEAMMNSAKKEDTILIMSTKFQNKLRQELGDTYNPGYWTEFTNRFGQVIEDTFEDDTIMFIVDKGAISSKSVFSEFTNTYYTEKTAFKSLTKWKDFYMVNPIMNIVSFKFTRTTKAVKELELSKKDAKEAKKVQGA